MRWFSMGTQTFNDPKVVRLGERHGPLGLAFWTALLCNAGAQEKAGKVCLTFRSLAHELFAEPAEVSAVLHSAVEVGLIRLDSSDEMAFDAVIPAWERWQTAGRQARSRARRKANEQANVTDPSRTSHGPSRDVTTDRQTDRQTDSTPRAGDGLCQRLSRVAFAHGLSEPDPAAVVRIEQDFKSREDYAAVIDDFTHFWTDGDGKTMALRDPLASLRRRFYKPADPISVTKLDPDNPYDAQVREVQV